MDKKIIKYKTKGEQKMEFIVQNALEGSRTNKFADIEVGKANIKVIGVGGGGSNATSWVYKIGI